MLFGLVSALHLVSASADEMDELEAVRSSIQALEKKLAEKHSAKDRADRQLRDLENEINDAGTRLNQIRQQMQGQSEEQRQIALDRDAAAESLRQQQSLLAEQVRQSHRAGSKESLKLLLNQGSTARLGRMMAYYGYLSDARTQRIAAVEAQMARLEELDNRAARVAAAMAESEGKQQQTIAELRRRRAERESFVSQLQQQIRASGTAMAQLKQQESSLAALVAELVKELAEFPKNSEKPFRAVQGELAWPLRGTLLADFGQARSGSLRWQGVLIGAERGTPVRALYHGRVVFADWLAGMGLLVVIDHGGGYMSLYGHNDSIFKEAGDWVEPGQVISQVGESGGQTRPGLYLEIRRAGEPLNPNRWTRRRLAARQ